MSEQRLIDANALIEVIPSEEYCARMAIQNAPAVDAVSVVHGHWIHNEDSVCYMDECSVCHRKNHICSLDGDNHNCHDGDMNYCPNCGAKMDEVSE